MNDKNISMIIENDKIYQFKDYKDPNDILLEHKIEGKYINDLEENIKTLKEQKPLFYLTGNEFQKELNKDFRQQAEEFFNSFDNKIENSIINGDDIAMNGVGIRKMIKNKLYKEKCCALQAVPTLLTKHEDISKNAIIMNKELKWKDRDFDTYLVVGTIDIAGKEYVAEIVIHEYDNGEKTFYLEEVEDKGNFLVSFKDMDLTNKSITTPPKKFYLYYHFKTICK
ncbi:MAG: hypothetical protein Ta2D_12370 [Rickettsiales bacterium]|nr:MAG: hypothetical protein Ta2D_12370 [Rickettsiales bacterium]